MEKIKDAVNKLMVMLEERVAEKFTGNLKVDFSFSEGTLTGLKYGVEYKEKP